MLLARVREPRNWVESGLSSTVRKPTGPVPFRGRILADTAQRPVRRVMVVDLNIIVNE